jgi:hypothetical protein
MPLRSRAKTLKFTPLLHWLFVICTDHCEYISTL